MNVIDTEMTRSRTAELAYHFYLERQRLGIPGDERDDWIRAEKQALPAAPAIESVPPQPLTSLRGIGPAAARQLAEAGIRSAEDLARLSLVDLAEKLPRLASRAKTGRWIEQARELSGLAS